MYGFGICSTVVIIPYGLGHLILITSTDDAYRSIITSASLFEAEERCSKMVEINGQVLTRTGLDSWENAWSYALQRGADGIWEYTNSKEFIDYSYGSGRCPTDIDTVSVSGYGDEGNPQI